MTFDEPKHSFNDELKLLALEVQKQPHLTPKRQLALNKLLQAIQQPSETTRLKISLRAIYPNLRNELFQDLFDEALQETLIAISRYIDNYNPQRQLFISWVIGILKHKFHDVYRKYSRTTSVKILSFDGLEEFVVDAELENSHSYKEKLAKEKLAFDCDFLRELLIKDPDNQFQKHIKGKPELTFQYIAKALYIEGIKMTYLSKKLNLPNTTLTSFFSRELARLKPYFQEKL
ncbi:hypothetical protein H6G33_02105 [Calothrix sp. FACHB-1219]|uniref:hypothetical protein n=1 Tax=unclassified Calothrix TaxID=2619626 RepID=UPI0016860D91|nr:MULTISPECIES: hypothetical protein [unclassified Calothrix]MBD2201397.1 hypothetical protein [Calothrix sp. FACHB-168]MBD2215829.1 hypothetical protein [Calothrix sp. FACHB-1219]